ncbi:MAG: cation:proton antiporter [Chromatiales bacterium]|jgi:predicted Kef-type K+ transport protein
MDPIWIAVAFGLGLAARRVGLPPLVGFLVAGFVLNGLGAEGGTLLEEVAALGITLLLFTIGLKLRVETLFKAQVWGVASLHMGATLLVLTPLIWLAAAAGLASLGGSPWGAAMLIAFALSFSSTVFAVKVLEDRGEMASNHGRTAIGILIMQDIAAVVFLVLSTGKLPAPWAVLLLALIPLRPILTGLMNRSGHGELLILYGLLMAVGSAALFDLVQVKGDLGALLVGMLLAGHPKSSELAKALLGFKDLFLVGFFLSIGMGGLPDLPALGLGVLLVAALPLKVALYFWLMTRFHLRVRTGFLASLSLANYSEFGLIVGAVGVGNGWLEPQWLGVLAIAVALTFVLASPLNALSHALYDRLHDGLQGWETARLLPEDRPVDPGAAEILIFGMGHVGNGAYEAMEQRYGKVVLGLDYNPRTVEALQESGRNVIRDDATDPDFWRKLQPGRVRLVMLTLSSHQENLLAAQQLKNSGYSGRIAAIARYPDEMAELEAAGVDAAFNVLAEAGAGFADHVCAQLVA